MARPLFGMLNDYDFNMYLPGMVNEQGEIRIGKLKRHLLQTVSPVNFKLFAQTKLEQNKFRGGDVPRLVRLSKNIKDEYFRKLALNESEKALILVSVRQETEEAIVLSKTNLMLPKNYVSPEGFAYEQRVSNGFKYRIPLRYIRELNRCALILSKKAIQRYYLGQKYLAADGTNLYVYIVPYVDTKFFADSRMLIKILAELEPLKIVMRNTIAEMLALGLIYPGSVFLEEYEGTLEYEPLLNLKKETRY